LLIALFLDLVLALGCLDASTAENDHRNQDHDEHSGTLSIPRFVTIQVFVAVSFQGDDSQQENVKQRRVVATHTEAESSRLLVGSVLLLLSSPKRRVFAVQSGLSTN